MGNFKYWWLTHRPKRQLNIHKPRPGIEDVPWWNLIVELITTLLRLGIKIATPVTLVAIYFAIQRLIDLLG